eukprot:gene13080-15386_t
MRSTQYKQGTYNSPPGNGESYAKFEGVFSVDEDVAEQLKANASKKIPSVDLVFYNYDDYDKVGYHSGKNDVDYCCTQSLVNDGKCSTVGTIIVKDSIPHTNNLTDYTLSYANEDSIQVYNYDFKTLTLSNSINIPIQYNTTKSGVYYLMITSCQYKVDEQTYLPIYVNGKTTFMNPYGYLEAEDHPFLYFYLFMATFYILVAIYYLYLCYKFRSTLLRLQLWVGLIILCGFIEMMVSYGAYSQANKTGSFSGAGSFFVALFQTLKNAGSRAIVLVVAMGYGVIIPTLPRMTVYKVGSTITLYSIFNLLQLYIQTTPAPTASREVSYIIFSIPVALLDTLFYWWIFFSFTKIMGEMNLKRQKAKIDLYSTFFVILIVSAIVSVILALTQIIMAAVKSMDETWTFQWMWSGFWDCTYYVVLCAIVMIWKPTANNNQYAYSELPDTGDEVTLQPMGGSVTQRLNVQRETDDGSTVGGNIQQEQDNSVIEIMQEDDEIENYKKGKPSYSEQDSNRVF